MPVLFQSHHHPQPDIYINRDGDNLAIIERHPQPASLYMLYPRKSRFEATVWSEISGVHINGKRPPPIEDIADCDATGCVWTDNDMTVAISKDIRSLAEDCRRADLVLAVYPVSKERRSTCQARLIDRRHSWDEGAMAIFLTPTTDANAQNRITLKSSTQIRGQRPWSGD